VSKQVNGQPLTRVETIIRHSVASFDAQKRTAEDQSRALTKAIKDIQSHCEHRLKEEIPSHNPYEVCLICGAHL
jgi:hypothetical protein